MVSIKARRSKLAKDRGRPIRQKIVAFQRELSPLLPNLQPRRDFEDADTRVNLIQSVIRIARNDAGHPTGMSAPSREEVYVFIVHPTLCALRRTSESPSHCFGVANVGVPRVPCARVVNYFRRNSVRPISQPLPLNSQWTRGFRRGPTVR